MTLFHATEPWAVVVLLGPLWLAAVGFAASRFGRWGCAGAVLLGIAGFVLVFLGEAGDPNRLYGRRISRSWCWRPSPST